MTTAEKLGILTDLDYARVYGPVAWGTIFSLLLDKRFEPKPYAQIQLRQLTTASKTLAKVFAWTHHKVLRPEKPQAVEMLNKLKAQFTSKQMAAQFGVLSGRTPETHPMTHALIDPQIGTLFSPDLIFLNPGYKSSEFKLKTIIELVRTGMHVIMIEDDFKTGWLLTNHPEIPKHLLDVYLISNLSARRILRYRGQYDDDHLPWNLHIMSSYQAIQDDISLHFICHAL